MLASSKLFKLFPPPAFLLLPHTGLDISDDGIRFISYRGVGSSRKIAKSGSVSMPEGLFVGGDIKDEKLFVSILSALAKEHGIKEVKVSIPEEKAYLFQTNVPTTNERSIVQNIESKIEENVPLSAPDAVFYFDLLPRIVTGGDLRASVSVVPRTYIERYTKLLSEAGLAPVSFETAPKAIARAVIRGSSEATRLIIHRMKHKTGIYIASGGAIHFTFTSPWGIEISAGNGPQDDLAREIARIRSFWLSHGNGRAVSEAMVVGDGAEELEPYLQSLGGDMPLSVIVPNVWENAFDVDSYLPHISRAESLGYSVAIGLAFDTHHSFQSCFILSFHKKDVRSCTGNI